MGVVIREITHTHEEYIEALKEDVLQKRAKRMDPTVSDIDGNRIAETVCDRPVFQNEYKDSIRYGCMKATTDNSRKFLALFGGQQVGPLVDRQQSEIFRRRKEVRRKVLKHCRVG